MAKTMGCCSKKGPALRCSGQQGTGIVIAALLIYKYRIMKTLLVPTDFSPAATNATNYAADMALAMGADLYLLHVYQVPIAVTDVPLVLVSVDELKQEAE